jgi:NADH:ubiquinone oxidoreductase subunit 6 (subunit J)
MSKNLSYGLIGLAVVLVLLGVLNHFVLGLNFLPHTSIIIGVLAVIVGAVGVFGMLSSSRTA